eukprot:GHVU01104029.1.p1 GENE.GHVU01104029.1~~GHVU01104029.1.p1  ORF type:complete len:119 (+),score=3.76 GHVU01104029.1:44-358(+)
MDSGAWPSGPVDGFIRSSSINSFIHLFVLVTLRPSLVRRCVRRSLARSLTSSPRGEPGFRRGDMSEIQRGWMYGFMIDDGWHACAAEFCFLVFMTRSLVILTKS